MPMYSHLPLRLICGKANSLVECPMCKGQVRYDDLNTHIDRGCKDPVKPKPSSSSAWSKLMANPSKQKGKQKWVCPQ
jgi:E3 ubiquitin-protein ligase RAD18